MDPLRLLIVEDSEDDALLILREIRRGAQSLWSSVEHLLVVGEADFEAALDSAAWDLVIADYAQPVFGALAALAIVIRRGLDIPFLVISGRVGEEMAVEAMKSGAHD